MIRVTYAADDKGTPREKERRLLIEIGAHRFHVTQEEAAKMYREIGRRITWLAKEGAQR